MPNKKRINGEKMSDKKEILSGCGTKNGKEIDGQEFDVETLHTLIDVIRQYKEVHLNYFEDEDDLDLWIKLKEGTK
jgi:hypothetical protein